jgi:uncharacterized YigZ family protein
MARFLCVDEDKERSPKLQADSYDTLNDIRISYIGTGSHVFLSIDFMSDEYKTIQAEVQVESKVQSSRFIASASPSSTKSEAEEFIARRKKRYHDATHNCFAYRCGTDGSQYRFNDDGEPSGSAGKPILAAIDKFGMTDVVIVVTRYFGGTKLGVGGLIRAYGDAAEQALASTRQITRYILDLFRISFPHSHISNVMHVTSKCGARIVDTVYDEEVHLVLEIRKSKAEELRSSLVNHTSGNVRIKSEI